MLMVHPKKIYVRECDFTAPFEPSEPLFIIFAFRKDRNVHSLPKEWSLFDEVYYCKATDPYIFTFTTKKEPIIVTVSINIIF